MVTCPADECSGGEWLDYDAECASTCDDLGECEACACSPSGGCYTVSGSCGGADTCADVNTKIVGSVCTGCGANGASGTCEGGGTFTCSLGTHTECQTVS